MAKMRCLLALTALAASLSFAAAPPTSGIDLHGDPLPSGARVRLGTIRLRHAHMVSSVAFSGDGKFLVSAASDHLVRLHDAKTGRLIRSIGKEQSLTGVYHGARWITSVAISADGKTVAAGNNAGLVCVCDAATGRELHRLGIGYAPLSLAFGTGGKTVALSGPRVGIYDLTGGTKIRWLNAPPTGAMRVAFSLDGKTLAAGSSDGTVRLWNVATDKELLQLKGHRQSVTSVAFSPDGKMLVSAGAGGGLFLRNTTTGKGKRLFAHKGGVAGVAFLPDGKTIVSAGMADGLILLHEVGTHKTVRRIEQPDGNVTAMALSPDGKTMALVTGDTAVRLWDVGTGRRVAHPASHEAQVHFLAFSAKGRRVFSAGFDNTFRVWQAATGKQLQRFAVGGTELAPLAFSSSGRVALAALDGGVVLHDPQAAKAPRRLTGYADRVSVGALTADGRRLATADGNGEIRLWDADAGKELRRITGHKGTPVVALAFSPSGDTLASSGANATVRLWDAQTGRELWRAAVSRQANPQLVFSADGRSLATGGTDGIVRVWETMTGHQVRAFTGLRGYVMSAAFSPDGRSLAAGNWMGVRLFDLGPRTARGEALGYQGDARSLAFSPDGKTLASGGSDTTVLLWDVAAAFQPAAARGPAPTAKALQTHWTDLALTDGGKAYDAIWALAAAPEQAVALLAKHLDPIRPASAKRLAALIKDLESEEYEVKSKATRELEALGEAAGKALRKALDSAKDVDLRLRLNVLIGGLDRGQWTPAQLRTFRALQVLELAGTPASRRLLNELAKGAPEARLTREASASAKRLAQRLGRE
jgi:WD40 repeat protein